MTCISHFLTHQLQTRKHTKNTHHARRLHARSNGRAVHYAHFYESVLEDGHTTTEQMNRAVTVYPLPGGSQITVRVQSVDLY